MEFAELKNCWLSIVVLYLSLNCAEGVACVV